MPSAHWWISTPHWTIAATVQDGVITDIAPILRRQWLHQPWPAFGRWVKRVYAGRWMARRLAAKGEPSGEETTR